MEILRAESKAAEVDATQPSAPGRDARSAKARLTHGVGAAKLGENCDRPPGPLRPAVTPTERPRWPRRNGRAGLGRTANGAVDVAMWRVVGGTGYRSAAERPGVVGSRTTRRVFRSGGQGQRTRAGRESIAVTCPQQLCRFAHCLELQVSFIEVHRVLHGRREAAIRVQCDPLFCDMA